MAYMCYWSCVSKTLPTPISIAMAPVQPVSASTNVQPTMTFVAALVGQKVVDDIPFPTPCLKGDTLSIKICQEEYQRGLED